MLVLPGSYVVMINLKSNDVETQGFASLQDSNINAGKNKLRLQSYY